MYAPLYIAHLSTLYIAHLVFAHCIGIEPVRLHSLGLFLMDALPAFILSCMCMNCTVRCMYNTYCVLLSIDSQAKVFKNNVDIRIYFLLLSPTLIHKNVLEMLSYKWKLLN